MKKCCFWLVLAISLVSTPMMVGAENLVFNLEPLIYADETDISNANLSVEAKGSNRLEPTLSLAYRTESNFYLVDSNYFDERRVDTFLVQPGITFGYRSGKSRIDLEYTLNIFSYDDQDDLQPGQRAADDFDYVGHTLNVNVVTQPTARFELGLREYFTKTRDQSEADHTTGLVGIQEKYNYNLIEPWLNYRFGERLSSRIAYRNTLVSYKESNPEDATENRGLFDMRYHFSPRDSLAVDYQVWKRDYDENNADYTSNRVGLIYRRNAKFIYGEAGIGYHHRSFSDNRDSKSTPSFLLAVTAQSSGLDEIGRPKSYATLSFDKDFNSSGVNSNFIDMREVSLTGGYTFLDRILADVKGYYRMYDYEDAYGVTPGGSIESRDDDRYGLIGSVGYKLGRWLVFSVRGGYESRNSNLRAFDYDNTYVMARLDSSYDFNLK